MTDHWPENVKPGRRVRATETRNDDIVHTYEYTVDSIDSDGELVARDDRGIRRLLGVYPHGWSVEVLPQPLPTEPGVYIDNEGDYWRIRAAGDPLCYWSTANGLMRPDADGAPTPGDYTFTRLIPEGAAE